MKLKYKENQLIRAIYKAYNETQTDEQLEYYGNKKEVHLFGGKIYIGNRNLGNDYIPEFLTGLKEKGMVFYKGNHRYELSAAGYEYVEGSMKKKVLSKSLSH